MLELNPASITTPTPDAMLVNRKVSVPFVFAGSCLYIRADRDMVD